MSAQPQDGAARAAEPAIAMSLRSLGKDFGARTAVHAIDLDIRKGQILGLLGPNGAGKTTTISMACGVVTPSRGAVLVDGVDLAAHPRRVKAQLGLVPQELAIYQELDAVQNLSYFGALHGLRGAALRQRVDWALHLAGLTDRAREVTATYSGGMKRRLNLAAGLVHRPRVLILDEPTVGVDPQSRNALFEGLEALKARGKTLIYTTHYMEEAERLCDRIAIIDSGRIQAEGTRDELIDLIGGLDTIDLEGTGDLAAAAAGLRALPAITHVDVDQGHLQITAQDATSAVADIVNTANRAGMKLSGVEVSRPTLESVFLHLTGKALRDRTD